MFYVDEGPRLEEVVDCDGEGGDQSTEKKERAPQGHSRSHDRSLSEHLSISKNWAMQLRRRQRPAPTGERLLGDIPEHWRMRFCSYQLLER